ncbi:MAG: MCE family protein [Actinobacteria bacterium]|nr:MCE family protein [Actinomycetota bacterium]
MRRLLRPRAAITVVGMLVLSLTASACGLLGSGDAYTVNAEFSRAYNLFPGSPVRVLGVDVGKIADLHVEPGKDTVRVEMLIDEGVEIPADAGALVIPEALLGERYVQLEPAYTGGETLEDGGVIPLERTVVPYEFDEVLESLNQFVGGLEPPEVGRMFDNVAEVIDGQGATLGKVIDQAAVAIEVLAENDEEFVSLAGRLADLNETLATRDEAIGPILEDWNTVASTLADERTDIDGALRGLVRLTTELGSLLETHRTGLEEDFEVLTRVGRTAQRNLDNISLLILGSAELFRHAERVIDREHNWLPLQNHSQQLGPELARTVANRLIGLCERAGIPAEECEGFGIVEEIGGSLCLDPIVPCPAEDEPGGAKTVAQAVRDVFAANPEFREAVADQDDGSADRDGDGDPVNDIADGFEELLRGNDDVAEERP